MWSHATFYLFQINIRAAAAYYYTMYIEKGIKKIPEDL